MKVQAHAAREERRPALVATELGRAVEAHRKVGQVNVVPRIVSRSQSTHHARSGLRLGRLQINLVSIVGRVELPAGEAPVV